jgi:diacylglycerol O-acyltransferase
VAFEPRGLLLRRRRSARALVTRGTRSSTVVRPKAQCRPLGGIALTDEDRAILALESAAVVGHTCKVVLVASGAPTAERLRASVVERLPSVPALTRRLGGTAERPVWVDDECFDVAAHVVAADVDPCDDESMRMEVARLFAERLDRSRPLWRIDVLQRADDGAALVWRIHHALADGTTAMRVADAVLWDAVPGAAGAAAPPPHPSYDESERRLRRAAFLRHELTLGHRRSPFDGTIGAQRVIAFAGAPLQALHDAAHRLAGATVNDAVLTAVAGGLRAWIRDHHGHAGKLRVKVPVSLHHAGDDEGNRDSFFTVELPLDEPDPVARLTAIRAATAARKADHDAESLDRLMHDLVRVSPQLEHLVRRLEASPRAFALNVSNVPGPRTAVAVLGVPVEAVYSIAEIGERHALRVAVVSVAGRLHFGLCSDPAIVGGIDVLAAGVEAEATRLVAAAD